MTNAKVLHILRTGGHIIECSDYALIKPLYFLYDKSGTKLMTLPDGMIAKLKYLLKNTEREDTKHFTNFKYQLA